MAEGSSVRRSGWLREVWASSIGKKVIVAITGLILAGYVVLHALGNLKALQGDGGSGEAPIDRYAEWLRTIGEPALPHETFVWALRAFLIAALVLHIAAITTLTKRNRAARPAGYQSPPRIQRSLSSRTMMLSGLVLLVFIVFHILQFTSRTIQITPIHEGTVYANVYGVFEKWYFALFYIGVMVLLGLHMRHALWSITQTAGWDKPNRNATFRGLASGVAAVVTVAFIAVPVAFWSGAMPSP